jgi:short subunit dehydrogenase-like uncharacterized protein
VPDERAYDIAVFGATGFTGRLAAEYLVRRPGARPERLALAGRHRAKLEATREALAGCRGLALLEAEAGDAGSLEARLRGARRADDGRLRYGEGLVRACAAATDYVDLTGGALVDAMSSATTPARARAGARIVHACGFDSIPADSARFALAALPEGEFVDVAAYVETGSGDGDWRGAARSGRHLALAIGFLSPGEVRARAAARADRSEPRRAGVAALPGRIARAPAEVGGWALPMPTIDREVVLRSAAAEARYGPRFRYGHHLRVGSLAGVAGFGIGAMALFGLAQLPPARRLLLSLKQPGEGPGPEQRARNRFCVTFVARARGERAVARVRGGDPGYGDTAKMIGEAAPAAEDRAKLPDRAGVLTPVLAMGDALLPRLEAAGIVFERVASP